MVVGMQHQQQQPHASPATVLEDATTPCAVSPPTSSGISVNGDTSDGSETGATCSAGKAAITTNMATYSYSRVKLRDVNPHLVCVLCHGYFVDATSIAECLHSFCRSCIILYLETKSYCPICEVQINKSKPHLSLKPDKTLQDIVYKLVPGLFHSEMKRRKQFYQDHPYRDLHLHPEFRGVTVDRLVYSSQDSVCLSLEYYDKSKEKEDWDTVGSRVNYKSSKQLNKIKSDDDNVPKKYFQCPAGVRVNCLKKLIRLKYAVDDERKVELFYRRESLPDEYSLMDIAYIYAWKRNTPMRLYYRINIFTATNESHDKLTLNSADEISSQSSAPAELETVKRSPIENTTDTSDEDKHLRVSVPQPVPSTVTPISTSVTFTVAKTKPNVTTKVSKSSPKCKPAVANSKPMGADKSQTPIKSYLSISSILNDIDKPDAVKKQVKPRKSDEPRKASTGEVTCAISVAETSLKTESTSKCETSALRSQTPTNVSAVVPELPRGPLTSTIAKTVTVPVLTQPVLSTGATSLSVNTEKTTVVETKTSTSDDTIVTTTGSEIKTCVTLSSVTLDRVKTATTSDKAKNATDDVKVASTVTNDVKSTSTMNDVKSTSTMNDVKSTSTMNDLKTASMTANDTKTSTTDNVKTTPMTNNVKIISTTANGAKTTSTTANGVKMASTTANGVRTASTTAHSVKTTSTTAHGAKTTSTTANGVKTTSTTSNSVKTTSITISTKQITVPSSVPPLITIASAPSTSSSTFASAAKDFHSSKYILSNTKIPSSLEISLSSPKDANKTTNGAQKMVNGCTTNGVKMATKRTLGEEKKGDEKKLCLQNFSPNILPEVSITVNPHPEQTKRISPETSYDVSCFKPKETNGIPPLAPINIPVCKNIQNSPIKNLNKKLNNVRAVRTLNVAKNRPKSADKSSEPETKKRCLENSSQNGTESGKEKDESKPDTKTTPKKEARHQSIPKLIDITTAPYAKLMAQDTNARRKFLNNLYIKPPENTNTEDALDLSSPSSKSPSSKSDTSSDKKIIPSVPPLIIPETKNKSPSSLSKIERKPSPIAKLEKSPNRKPEFRLDNGSASPKTTKSPSDKSPSTPVSRYSPFSKTPSPIGSLRFSPPELFANAASLNFLRQQRDLRYFSSPLNGFNREAAAASKFNEDWIVQAFQYGLLPAHPLIHPALVKPPTSQESTLRFKK